MMQIICILVLICLFNLCCESILTHRSHILNSIVKRPTTSSLECELPSASSIAEPPSEVEQYHGTTTIAFINGENIIICVDSKASIGNFVGSRTVNKILPITDTVVATMAGGAADCFHWIREVSKTAKVMEFDNGGKLPVVLLARLLAARLREYRGKGLSVGTMVAGIDASGPSLHYVDSDGTCAKGSMFCVGSGAVLAYSILDSANSNKPSGPDSGSSDLLSKLPLDLAVETALRSVRHATVRDGYSGGMVQVVQLNSSGVHLIKRVDCRSIVI